MYNGYYYGFDMTYLVLVVPALLIALIAQIQVKSAFSRYAGVRCTSGLTGAQAAHPVHNTIFYITCREKRQEQVKRPGKRRKTAGRIWRLPNIAKRLREKIGQNRKKCGYFDKFPIKIVFTVWTFLYLWCKI